MTYQIQYIDRLTKKIQKEQVYGKFFLELLYSSRWISHVMAFLFLPLVAKNAIASKLYGLFQKSSFSRHKIKPFIEKFDVDASEFRDPIDSFRSFNDFFIRHLNATCRPIAQGEHVAVLPADARYLFFQDLQKVDGIVVKGETFSLVELLQSEELAQKYANGSMAIARLCPTDYHRFHFPCACMPGEARLINGPLYSVNPIALKKNIHILSHNKRVVTPLQTKQFGTVLYIEVGATYVGSIIQTFSKGEQVVKGDEKGYFSFGGSCIILLFEPKRIEFDADLLDASAKGLEVKALFGQSMGTAFID